MYDTKTNAATTITDAGARAAGLLVVDLGDGWAPFIFQDGGIEKDDPPKPNGYRQTFIDLANDRVDPNGHPIAGGDHNFLEPFGIPPTLSVLRARVEDDLGGPRVACESRVDGAGLSTFTGNVGYVDRERARRDHVEAMRDGDWLDKEIARREQAASSTTGTTRADATVPDAGPLVPSATWTPGDRTAAIAALRGDANARLSARVDRAARGQERIRAVRAAQARLTCEGLLSPRARFTSGMFDLPTHEALASWERKNDVFGWAFLGGETLSTLSRSPLDLDLEAFRRVLAERVADAAGIVEDGSAAKWKESGGSEPVRNLIAEYVTALLASLHVATPVEMAEFLRQHGPDGLATLRVAFRAPALPSYYGPHMDLSVEIDRGDVWYDFPFDPKGRPIEQAREHFPHLTLFVSWRGQKIPLCQWRTTVGSWRSELHENGKIYYKYKNSDVGPRVWKQIVAGPVWIPPDATPVKDLLIRKVLDRDKGPEWVVNTDVMGPGFQSAYGLVMAIHTSRDGFDNQIRTHGSVDYTSIARRFSHGCHRLVNDRAVRLFDFILRHQPFRRVGSVPLRVKRQFTVEGAPYAFELKTRGYYYELPNPIAVTVAEGRVMGRSKAPITAYVRKAGVDYGDVSDLDGKRKGAARARVESSPSDGDAATSATSIGGSSEAPPPALDEPEPAIGP